MFKSCMTAIIHLSKGIRSVVEWSNHKFRNKEEYTRINPFDHLAFTSAVHFQKCYFWLLLLLLMLIIALCNASTCELLTGLHHNYNNTTWFVQSMSWIDDPLPDPLLGDWPWYNRRRGLREMEIRQKRDQESETIDRLLSIAILV